MVTHDFFLAVTPKATARSRCGCKGRFPYAYTEGGYREWLDSVLPHLHSHAPNLSMEIRERPVRITVEARVRKPKTSKRRWPRGDDDNYEKGLWDAMTKVGKWWVDDDQIVENLTRKRFVGADEEEGYQVTVQFLEHLPHEDPPTAR